MGMAASQARFLGLTARKSNVEFEGQQVNQQRTALANESANIYQQISDLTVPTPPSESSFYTLTYTIDDSSSTYVKSDYTIDVGSLRKTGEHENEYYITISSTYEYDKSVTTPFKKGTIVNDEEAQTHTIVLLDNATGLPINADTPLLYDENDTTSTSDVGYSKWQIYEIPEDGSTLPGYTTVKDDPLNEGIDFKYFFIDTDGNYYYMDQDTLDSLYDDSESASEGVSFATTKTDSKETSTTVKGYLETSSNGRYTSITIEDDEEYPAPSNLAGTTKSITCTKSVDEAAKEQAELDYEYDQYIYNQKIQELNAKSSAIQSQDKKLEMKMEQLDTEEKALSTEMESVDKVIGNNVEKTFNAFA